MIGDVAVGVFLVLTVALAALACLGTIAMRSVYASLHYLAPASVAAICLAAAVWIEEGPSLLGLKAVLVALILLVTSPVLTHVIAQGARQRERGDWRLGDDESIQVEP